MQVLQLAAIGMRRIQLCPMLPKRPLGGPSGAILHVFVRYEQPGFVDLTSKLQYVSKARYRNNTPSNAANTAAIATNDASH